MRIRLNIIVWILLFVPGFVFAQFNPESFSKLNYATAIPSLTLRLDTVADGNYFIDLVAPGSNWRTRYKHNKVKDYITIAVKDTSIAMAKYDYNFNIQVDRYDVNGTKTTFNTTMRFSYDPAQYKQYRDVSVYQFSGAHRFVCTITGVTDATTGLTVSWSSVKKNFTIEEKINVERYYLSNYDTSISVSNITTAVTPGKIRVDWTKDTTVKGPVQYELEWLFADNYTGGYPEYVKDYTVMQQLFADSPATLAWDSSALVVWGINSGNLYFKTASRALKPLGGNLNSHNVSVIVGHTYRVIANLKYMEPSDTFQLWLFNSTSTYKAPIALSPGPVYTSFTAATSTFTMAVIGSPDGTYMIDDITLVDITWPGPPPTGGTYTKPDSLMAYDFINNATRIRTSGKSYIIENVFEKGDLLYRLRRVRPDSVFFTYEKFSRWAPVLPDSGNVKSWTQKIALTTPHTGDTLNWNYQVNYIEEGKRKDVTSYYDGLLKPRQQVAVSNTDTMVIIGESKYDFQGRPTVQILPVPALKPNGTAGNYYEKDMKFYYNFNRNLSSKPYSASQFDSTTNVCPTDTSRSLFNSNGAARYYSSNNPDKTNAQKFTPDAEGYPMTEVEYMADNSGRVKRQSGVGKTQQIGNGKETVYFYEQPQQPEIDRVFGSEAGYAGHYKKVEVEDPNGQVSVKYVDMQGRTIATAMVGANPANLDVLPNNKPYSLLYTDLTRFNYPDQTNNIELSYPFNLFRTGPVYIDYRLQTSNFRNSCMAANLCFKCVYNYEVSLVNTECNQVVFSYKDTIGFLNPADTVCGVLTTYKLSGERYNLHTINAQVDTVYLDSFIRVLNMTPGQYVLHKKLTINPGAYDMFYNIYQQKASCVKTFDSFFSEALSKIDFSGCSGCDTCNNIDYCSTMRDLMKMDVSPGGQYFMYTLDTSGNVVPANDSTSVLYGNRYQLIKSYRTVDDAISLVPMTNGTLDSVYKADVNTFVRYFQTDWADSLIRFHPEYCYYRYCKDSLTASYRFDFKLYSFDNYDSAFTKGYMNPTQVSGLKYNFPNNPIGYDSFFLTRPVAKNSMNWRLTQFKTLRGKTYSAWDIAALEAFCGPITDDTREVWACLEAFANQKIIDSIFMDRNRKNTFLRSFQAMYTSAKSQVIDSLMRTAPARYNAAGYNCPSCFVGQSCGSYTNKQRRYYFGYSDGLDHTKNDSLQGIDIGNQANTALQNDSMCTIMGQRWMDALVNCPYIKTQALRDSIKAGLIYVCQRGRLSQATPMGVPVSQVPSTDLTARFHSFDEVLKYYLDTANNGNYRTRYCNVSLLGNVYALNHNYSMPSDSQACGCVVENKIKPPIVVLKGKNTTYNTRCLKDTAIYTQFAQGLPGFLNEMKTNNTLTSKFSDVTYTNYITYMKKSLPYEYVEAEIVSRKYSGALSSRNSYEWHINFLDDTSRTKRCNIFFKMGTGSYNNDSIRLRNLLTLPGTFSNLVVIGDSFTIQAPGGPPIIGWTHCDPLVTYNCLVTTTDTLYGKPDYVDTTGLSSFSVLAQKMRTGLADSTVAKYLTSGSCGYVPASASGNCMSGAVPPRVIAMVKALSEGLYQTRVDASKRFTGLTKDTFTATNDGQECGNGFMVVSSPTYGDVFSIDWSRYDGYKGTSFSKTNDHSPVDSFDDNNIYFDPYFIGISYFGINSCDPQPQVINCSISFGHPNNSNSGLVYSAIDSFYNVRFDTTYGGAVCTARANGKIYTLTIKSCEDQGYCGDFGYANAGNYMRTYLTNDKVPKKFSYTCYEPNKFNEAQHDYTVSDQAVNNPGSLAGFVPYYLQAILTNLGSNLTNTTTYTTTSAFGMTVPAAIDNLLDTFKYKAEIVNDSLLIASFGHIAGVNKGCQLALRLLDGDTLFSFGAIDSFSRIRPDDEKLNEYFEKGEFDKGKYFFIITAKDKTPNPARYYRLRGWFSCAPVYDCAVVLPPDETAPDTRCACATCPEVKNSVDSFQRKYPTVLYTDPAYKNMLTNFLNDQLNNNLTYPEYDNFMQTCNMFVNDTFKVRQADIRMTGTPVNKRCMQRADSIIKQINDSFGYTIKYTKWKIGSTYAFNFDLDDLPAADRVTFTNRVRDSLRTGVSCSGFNVVDTGYIDTCDIWVDFSRAGTDSSACYSTFATKYNSVVATRFGVSTLPSPIDFTSYLPFDTTNIDRNIHHYCLKYTGKTTSQKTDIYNVIDSLLNTCTYVSYGSTFLVKPSGNTFENKSICLRQWDTNYIAYQRMDCETCKDLYDKIVNYQNFTYQYRNQYGREGALTENIQTGLFNRYGLDVQLFESAPTCTGCLANLNVCGPSAQAYAWGRLFQHLESRGALYNDTTLTGDTFLMNSILVTNLLLAPDTYNPDTAFIRTDSVVLRFDFNVGGGGATFIISGDTNIMHIDTIFRIESGPSSGNNFYLVVGSRGVVYKFPGVLAFISPPVFGTFSMTNCCTVPKPALCFKSQYEASTIDTGDCRTRLTEVARANAYSSWEEYSDSVKSAYRQTYTRACLDSAAVKEKAGFGKEFSEYQFTLYYYDMSGNLVKTVPPAGTDTLLITSALGLQLDNNRKTYQTTTHVFTKHKVATRYKYNTQGQVVYQNTPDADSTKFYYDAAGRLVVSQNMRQMLQGNVFSYTIRDGLNRTVEVGEFVGPALNTDSLKFNYSIYYLNWLSRGTKKQITKTTYDTSFSATVNNLFPGGQQNLRARVSTVAYYEYNLSQYSYATHYTYDIHGNVSVLVQEYPELGPLGNRYKYLYYTYDLVSGKVNTVSYQPGQPDRFYHRYVYDADNRLIDVNTSPDSVIWDNDASYYYYKHGPLSRTELGDYKVQGVDYAYTVHGWLKGINSNTLDSTRDMGKDGAPPSALTFATDVFGFTLGYFTGDYKPIDPSYYNSAIAPISNVTGSPLAQVNNDLFNGNISHMVTAVKPLMSSSKPMASIFRYDQLNRITRMETYTNLNTSTNAWNSGSTASDYLNAYAYDPNGNITKLYRATSAGTTIDSLNYTYNANTNKLNWVKDNVASNVNTDDIDNQALNNYGYDKIGNLAEDKAENIDTILWNVYGKIKTIKRDVGSTKPGMEFRYDASGQRNVKIVKIGSNENRWVYTYYVRDAQGNIIATYQLKNDSLGSSLYTQQLKLKEHHIYGSSRVGVRYADTTLVLRDISISGYDSLGFYVVSSILDTTMLTVDTSNAYRTLAKKQYELSDHLGNVLANVMDRHTPIGASTISQYNADIAYGQYYYPFGMTLNKFNGDTTYKDRFAFNGKERDDKDGVIQYDYGFRIYDPRVARFKSVDPLTKSFPWYTPYQFAGNKPILAVDLDGLEEAYFHIYYDDDGKPLLTREEAIDIKQQIVPNSLLIVHHYLDGTSEEVLVPEAQVFGGTGMLTASNIPKNREESNDFGIVKTKLAASAGIGKELSLSRISLDKGLNNIFAGQSFINMSSETTLGGAEASVGISFGTGSFSNLGPFDNPQNIFLNSSGGNAEFSLPTFGAINLNMGSEWGTTSEGQGYSSNYVGLSFGKGLSDLGLKVKGSNSLISGSVEGTTYAVTKLKPPSLLDSARTAIKNLNDTNSKKYMNTFLGNPERAAELDRQIENSKE